MVAVLMKLKVDRSALTTAKIVKYNWSISNVALMVKVGRDAALKIKPSAFITPIKKKRIAPQNMLKKAMVYGLCLWVLTWRLPMESDIS